MSIKVWDYLAEYASERTDILAAVDRVFSSGTLVLGNSVRSFENEFSAYTDALFGVGVDNATNGLALAMKAVGVGPGDEVITVSNTAVPTVSAIAQIGAIPRFVDVHVDDALLDVSLLPNALTKRTKCIIPVHLYGQCVDMDPLNDFARAHGLTVIEDCSQSHGAKYKNRKAGSLGDLGVFSFYPTKPLGGYGDGGIVVTSRPDLDQKLRSLRFYGMKGVYYADELGFNSRLDEVHAEILRFKLSRLDQYNARRRVLADEYRRLLFDSDIILPTESNNNLHVYYVFVVRHRLRDRVLAALKRRDIHLNISYPWPIHTMRGFAYLGYNEGDFPVTEFLAREIFSLPMYPSLSLQTQVEVCSALREVLAEAAEEN
ncbi:DegT/DnrJ/EryC1/StrS family aminotransferase [Piscinibacter sakaiensis]|uniref:DegT/DnrJ/EryC1/StrS family aminotransferase n=1 Tax=Piscinibacter sakaiensis TaxID=1547922 RepID=UPI003AAFEB72